MSRGIQQTNIEQLTALQRIDSQSDVIINAKGSLPSSIEALQIEIAKIGEKKAIAKEAIDEFNQDISDLRDNMKYLDSQIVKYEEQLKATKNDREYEAISEDIEVQKIEIKLLKRKIPEKLQAIKAQNANLEELDKLMFVKENSLIAKQESLHQIQEKTGEQEKELQQEREKVVAQIEPEVYELYQKIRTAQPDATVDVVDNACNGCFMIVPAQRQLEIRLQKSLYTCENCGRILLNVIKPIVEEPKARVRRGRTRSRAQATASSPS